jgi:hypothetical protein
MASAEDSRYISLPDAEELRISINELHTGQDKINIAIVELSTTMKHMAVVQEKTADYGKEIALQGQRITILEDTVKRGDDARVSQQRWLVGIVVMFIICILSFMLPRVRFVSAPAITAPWDIAAEKALPW